MTYLSARRLARASFGLPCFTLVALAWATGCSSSQTGGPAGEVSANDGSSNTGNAGPSDSGVANSTPDSGGSTSQGAIGDATVDSARGSAVPLDGGVAQDSSDATVSDNSSGTIEASATDSGAAQVSEGGFTDGGLSCVGDPVWNSSVTYSDAGQLVEYNCNLYQNQGFAYDLDPETHNGQYAQWHLMGACSNSDCAMGEGPWIACGNYDHWTTGSYEVYNDVWGGDAGSQCITAWDGGHWTLQSTQPATTGVKSYPNSGFVNVNKTISSLTKFTSSFDITVPSYGDWEATYDIWVPSEIMIWMYTSGNVGPIASSWDSTGKPVASATDVDAGGHTWTVYHQNGGTNVISFVRTTNTTSATVDILALINWAKTQGWIPDGTIGASQFGFEISGTNSEATDFTCNSFSMTIN